MAASARDLLKKEKGVRKGSFEMRNLPLGREREKGEGRALLRSRVCSKGWTKTGKIAWHPAAYRRGEEEKEKMLFFYLSARENVE